MSAVKTIDSAPKDRRILGYGKLGWLSEKGWGTVKWDDFYKAWVCDPNEASEYSPEEAVLTHWADLPEEPKP